MALLAIAVGASLSCTTPASAPGADEALVRDLEAKSWAAWKAQDAAFFETLLADDHVEVHASGIAGKAAVVGAVRSAACTVVRYAIGPITVTRVSGDALLLAYRAEQDTTCGPNRVPSPVWVTSLYAKRAGRWVNVLFQQTPAS